MISIVNALYGVLYDIIPDLPNTALYTFEPWEAIISFLIATGLVLVGVYCMIMFATTHLTKVIAVGVIPFVADIAVFNGIYDVCSAMAGRGELRSDIGLLIANMPTTMRLSLMCLLMFSGILRLRAVRRTIKSTITEFSIGESLDQMPMGIAFAGDDGIVFQSNNMMQDICYRILGTTLVDADKAWARIVNGDLAEGMQFQGSETPMVKTPEGQVWMFSKTPIHNDIADINQIVAVNATREQRIVAELEEKTLQLADMNKRLRNYNHIVDDTIRREELLAAKMRVHDNMGEVLLATKVLLSNDKGPATPESVLLGWKKDLSLLREEAKDEAAPTQVDRLIDAAQHFGVDLQIIGEMPEDEDVTNLICVGIQECMTNAIQHADADQLYVTINKNEMEYEVIYSNNGAAPEGPVSEGGGLSILRQAAEKMDATMDYPEDKHFTLRLRIPVNRV